MLPPFDEHGNLPQGIHRCNFDELVARFGSGSPEREVEIKELRQFMEWMKSAGMKRLVINGSFVTNKISPNDVDIIILPGPIYPTDRPFLTDEEIRWPFLHIIVAADNRDLEEWALKDFGTDREQRRKGVVEVTL